MSTVSTADVPDVLSIIVPVFNEARTVTTVIARLRAVAPPLAREILVVDDGSTDGTLEVLQAMAGTPEVRLVHVPRNAGKGSAIREGLAHAGGTIIAIQDADLELDPQQLGRLVVPILDGETDVVYGSRFLDGSSSAPWKTVAANRFLTALTNLLYGASLTDMETCYKIMRTDVARSLALESNRFEIEPEITAKLLRCGHTIKELPVQYIARSRARGKKIGWRDGLRAMVVLAKYRFAPAGGPGRSPR
jgi:glycosyltransferase involved in cell wall biosynthesis